MCLAVGAFRNTIRNWWCNGLMIYFFFRKRWFCWKSSGGAFQQDPSTKAPRRKKSHERLRLALFESWWGLHSSARKGFLPTSAVRVAHSYFDPSPALDPFEPHPRRPRHTRAGHRGTLRLDFKAVGPLPTPKLSANQRLSFSSPILFKQELPVTSSSKFDTFGQGDIKKVKLLLLSSANVVGLGFKP